MKTAAIILCAGKSTRMGKDKALTFFQSKAFIVHIVEKYTDIADKIIVVTGDNHESVSEVLKEFDCDIILNTERELGMFSSVKAGITQLNENFQTFIHPVDCPFVTKALMQDLKEFNTDKDVIIPYIILERKRFGHPVLLKKKAVSAVKMADISDNLKSVINKIDSTDLLLTEDYSILHNINTPEDLKKSIQ